MSASYTVYPKEGNEARQALNAMFTILGVATTGNPAYGGWTLDIKDAMEGFEMFDGESRIFWTHENGPGLIIPFRNASNQWADLIIDPSRRGIVFGGMVFRAKNVAADSNPNAQMVRALTVHHLKPPM
jgi:hypothetical protein